MPTGSPARPTSMAPTPGGRPGAADLHLRHRGEPAASCTPRVPARSAVQAPPWLGPRAGELSGARQASGCYKSAVTLRLTVDAGARALHDAPSNRRALAILPNTSRRFCHSRRVPHDCQAGPLAAAGPRAAASRVVRVRAPGCDAVFRRRRVSTSRRVRPDGDGPADGMPAGSACDQLDGQTAARIRWIRDERTAADEGERAGSASVRLSSACTSASTGRDPRGGRDRCARSRGFLGFEYVSTT